MAKKSKQLIKMMALIDRKSKEITPDLYASVALALHRKYGWGYKRINELFKESHAIWEEGVQLNLNIREMCEEETGIEVVGVVNDK